MKTKLLLAAGALAISSAPATAADFSFVGSLSDPNDVLFFDFDVGSLSSVTLRTFSYAGGTNAAGTFIAGGNFDPILSLYNLSTGLRVGQNDDGGCSLVDPDPTTGACFDTFLQTELGAGSYRVAVTAFSNFGPETLSGEFRNTGSFNGRGTNFAFDVLNVDTAIGPGGVPEPTTWALFILGFGVVGASLRSRRQQVVHFA
ncbi:DVUA0089 family protein [Qipengyuania sp.]|uniref:DVUA0089 family protein n=1 Tax=Qipengyuania sp. TaxID=2004515 RepID=UPI0035C7EFAC